MLEIVARSESGLPDPTEATVEATRAHSLVLHHWGSFKPTTNARVRELRQLHLTRISDVGEAYNWLVGADAPGKVWELRGRGRRPGGQRNVNGWDNNTGTRSIVVNGDYRNPGDPAGPIPDSLIDTIARLVVREHLAGDMPDRITHGHTNYVRPDGKGCCQSTSCPGPRLLVAIPTINARIRTLLDNPQEDDMSLTPEEKQEIADLAARAVMGYWVRDSEGVAPGVEGNPLDGNAWHFGTVFRRIRADTKATMAKVSAAAAAGATAGAIAAELIRQLGG